MPDWRWTQNVTSLRCFQTHPTHKWVSVCFPYFATVCTLDLIFLYEKTLMRFTNTLVSLLCRWFTTMVSCPPRLLEELKLQLMWYYLWGKWTLKWVLPLNKSMKRLQYKNENVIPHRFKKRDKISNILYFFFFTSKYSKPHTRSHVPYLVFLNTSFFNAVWIFPHSTSY